MSRGLWDREMVAALLLAACLPLAATWLWHETAAGLARLGLAALVLLVWTLVFLLARAQPPSLASGLSALAVAILAPEDLGAVRFALGLSFGAVMGELVFGGWGRNVVNPATVALAFLGFGFPAAPWPEILPPVAWAAIPAALFGAALGVMPGALLISATLTASAAHWAGLLPMPAILAGGTALVLLVADPVTAATTPLGRWLHGALYTALLALFATGWQSAAPVQIAVAAAFLAALAAPLLDEAAIALWVLQRRRRHDRA